MPETKRREPISDVSGTPYRDFSALVAAICLSVLAAHPANSAELRRNVDPEGNVHFGTKADPNLCCMCVEALSYDTGSAGTVFSLRYGLERIVANERVFLSDDDRAWYCEGVREASRSTPKCGLVPQMN